MSPKLQALAKKHSIGRPLASTSRPRAKRTVKIPKKTAKYIPTSNLLSFNMERQLQSNWCWAATAKSVSVFYLTASTWTQCSVAQKAFKTPCCQAPHPCNTPWYLDRALRITGNFDALMHGSMTFASVKNELASTRLIGARIGWSGGGGHFMVIHGCRTFGGTNYLNIDDPIYGKSDITETVFSTQYQGSGKWTHTYKTKPATIAPQGTTINF